MSLEGKQRLLIDLILYPPSFLCAAAGGPGGRAAEGAAGVAGQDDPPGPEHQGLGAPAAARHGPAPGAGTGPLLLVHTGFTWIPGASLQRDGPGLNDVVVQWFPALCSRPTSLFFLRSRSTRCDPVSQPTK